MHNRFHSFLLLLSLMFCFPLSATDNNETKETRIRYLSGKGASDAVPWEFFITEGRNSGHWTHINVPSCWETEGFGQFQYGITFYGKPFPEGIAKEEGRYKHTFLADELWRGSRVELVFEASMTDTEVKLNGLKAGSVHQGGFYRFSFDVTDLLRYGKENLLEVTVRKESANASVNLAERRADYWNFGGIIRPVFLLIRPPMHIRRTAIAAEANGSFTASCFLGNAVDEPMSVKTVIVDQSGNKLQETETPLTEGSDHATLSMKLNAPACWTAETPHLYSAIFTLHDASGKLLHQTEEQFGFRTIEVRESDGLYINGSKVNIRGVNRHSFRPESGRTLNREKNYEDVRLIKSMNMNAVRLSHYPADPAFLEACDELGLYVMNELGGWHGKYDTHTGKTLVESLVTRDLNHPSVIWWSNGNEKGWNTELDGEFHRWDLQKRPVLHPQGNYGGFETMHYRSYGETQEYLRLPEIFMPTEILHGLYDGGHGAGLHDYWEMMYHHPRCAGAFLWVLADEGVKRVDQDGRIDNQGNYGADGIVGPHHEKEGSYFTVKQLWSPVQIKKKKIERDFDGIFEVENRYDFTNLSECTFRWEQVVFPSFTRNNEEVVVIRSGEVNGSDLPARTSGELQIDMPSISDEVNGLFVTAIDPFGQELWRWSWPVAAVDEKSPSGYNSGATPAYNEEHDHIILTAAGRQYRFSKENGTLEQVTVNGKVFSFGNGPRFYSVRRADRSLDQYFNHDDPDAKNLERTYKEFDDSARLDTIYLEQDEQGVMLHVQYKLGNMRKASWRLMPDGTLELSYSYGFDGVVDMMGVRFDYPESKVISKRWLGDGPYRVWQNRLHGTVYNVWQNRYNDPVPGESFTYPEFKGYFANCSWMQIKTEEGTLTVGNRNPEKYIGVYQPRDGRDTLLYTFPDSGLSILDVIAPVRNKVNTTDLIGPSSQPRWVNGEQNGSVIFRFE